MADRKLTNDDLLLQDGLVEYNDPIDGLKKQVSIEAAKRIALGNTIMRDHLISLGVIDADEAEEE